MSDENEDKFAIANFTGGQLNAMVKKLGGPNNVRKLLDGSLSVDLARLSQRVLLNGKVSFKSFVECVPTWNEKEGVIYFSVEYEKLTYGDRFRRLERMVSGVDDIAKRVMLSAPSEDKPCVTVVTKIAVFTSVFFQASGCKTIGAVCEVATKRGMVKPSVGVVIPVCEAFTNTDICNMGISHIVFMHEPSGFQIDSATVVQYQLVINANSVANRVTASEDAGLDKTLDTNYPNIGMAFEIPQPVT